MAARGLGIDFGSATLKAVEVEQQGGTYVPVRAVAIAPDGDLAGALRAGGIKSRQAVLGLTGKDLVVKYQQVPPVADFQLKKIVGFELAEIRQQSGDDLAADFNVMPTRADLTTDDIVLMALSREQHLDDRAAVLQAAGLAPRHFTPNAIALFHAFRIFGPATSGDVLLASIGKASSDFAVMRDGELLYARSVSTGGDVLTDAIAEQFNVSKAKAESLKLEYGDLRPRDRRSGLTPQAEKVAYALEGAAGRLFSMVQSTLQLAKGQMQLNQLDVSKVWLTGGAAGMKGLDDYLSSSLGVPVAPFDPVGEADVALEGAGSKEMTIALGLAVMAADPESWAVELLTGAERKRREWKGRHAFTLAAVAVVAAYLGLFAWQCQERHAAATVAAERVSRERKKRDNNGSAVEQLRVERAELAQKVDVLEKKKAAGDGLLRALGLLATRLPEDLWVGSLDLELQERKSSAKERTAKTPVYLIDGAGKSRGTRSIDESYAEFVDGVRALPAEDDLKPAEIVESQTARGGEIEYRLNLHWLHAPPRDPDAGDEEQDAGASGSKAGGR